MSSPSKIIVIGSLNIDYLASVESLPGPGETVPALGLLQRFGGKGANQAVAAARFGAEVGMIGCVGADDAGRAYVRRLREERISTRALSKTARALTGTALIAVDRAGENCIIVAPGANGHLTPADIRRSEQRLGTPDFVLLQLETPLVSVCAGIRRANKAGVPVALNPSPLRTDFPWGDCALDTVIVNAGEAQALFHMPVSRLKTNLQAWRRALARWRISRLVITRGARSTLCLTTTHFLDVPAFPVRPVDTVGAGDAFAGVLVGCLAERMELRQALCYANCAGALTTLAPGAQEALPNRKRIEQALRRYANKRQVSNPGAGN